MSSSILPYGAVLLISVAALGAQDLYVSPNGDDANSGALGEPVLTISRAVSLSVPGDTIHVRGGTYRQAATLFQGGAEGMPLTIKAYDGGGGPEKVVWSGFDRVVPGVNGAGQWELHAGSIYKIQLTADYGMGLGASTVLMDGQPLKEARWPNAPAAFDFDWTQMASPEGSSFDPASGGPEPGLAGTFYTGSYTDPELPDIGVDGWVGARIDLSPDSGVFHTTGIVTGSTDDSVTFRYPEEEAGPVSVKDPYFLWNSLKALDEPGEAFFDLEGVSGPAYTLYLWVPDGGSPVGREVELRRRSTSLDLNWGSHVRIEGIEFEGGGIFCPSSTVGVEMDRLAFRYCGRGLNFLGDQQAAVLLRGTGHSISNSTVGWSYGGGIHDNGTGNEVANNVVRDCMLYAIGTWGGYQSDVHHNTVFNNGGLNIAMFSPASKFRYNHCYLAGLRTTDEGGMNCHDAGDGENTEVAYNWVHTNVARTDLTYDWGGGRGIRLDRTPSNYVVHHNLIWDISSPGHSLILWSLDASQVNHGNSQIRAYNNTVWGQIRFSGSGSIGGHDVRNNICTGIRDFGVDKTNSIVRNNFLVDGATLGDWSGNYPAPDVFVSPTSGNFELKVGSPAIDAGELIPPYTDGYSGAAPDAGALESGGSGNVYFSVGAYVLPEHLGGLVPEISWKPSGAAFVVLRGLPEGRTLPEGFVLRLGGATELTEYRMVYSVEQHEAELWFEVPLEEVSGLVSVEYSLDGQTFVGSGDTINIEVGDFVLLQLVDEHAPAAGGSEHRVYGRGLAPSVWLLPLDFQDLTGPDLGIVPVPVQFDSKTQIDAGRMQPDCSDLRVVHWETQTELRYWIETGANTERTLLWVKYPEEGLGERTSQLDESSFFLTFGDPTRAAVSDPDVLFGNFTVLNDPSLKVWLSAYDLEAAHGDADPVSLWEDRSSSGIDGSQVAPGFEPTYQGNPLGEFPSVNFDGSQFISFSEITPQDPVDLTFVIVHRNAVDNDSQSRLISSRTNSTERYVKSGSLAVDWSVLATRRPAWPGMLYTTMGKRFGGITPLWMKGEVAEVLIFDDFLDDATDGPFEKVQSYVSRKYFLGGEARGVTRPADILAPMEWTLGGVPLEGVEYLSDREALFTAPAALPGGLPQFLELRATYGELSDAAPERLVYWAPALGAWLAGLPPGENGAGDNPDGDSMPNMLEFALDMDAGVFDTPGWFSLASQPGGPVTYTFRRSKLASDVLVYLEQSDDLITWTRQGLWELGVEVVDADPDGDGSAELLRVEIPGGAAGEWFWRFYGEQLIP